MIAIRSAALCAAVACGVAGEWSLAGPSAGFTVHVRAYTPAAGEQVCTSEARGDASSAVVRVLCTVGPFVTISPAPGQQTAVHSSEPIRQEVSPASPVVRSLGLMGASFDPRVAVGTLTSLQISNAIGNSSALEMLVSF